MSTDYFGALSTIDLKEGPTSFYRLSRLEDAGLGNLDNLPFSIRILLENALRHAGGKYVSENHVRAIAEWSPKNTGADIHANPCGPPRLYWRPSSG